MDEYDETEEDNNTLIVTIYSALLMSVYTDFSTALVTRNPSIFDQRLDWANFVDRHGAQSCFDQHIRMKKSSFEKLLDYIRPDLKVDPTMAYLRGGVILPEVALYCTLRYIAGGSYSDVYFMACFILLYIMENYYGNQFMRRIVCQFSTNDGGMLLEDLQHQQ
jgi:hypothetical protein